MIQPDYLTKLVNAYTSFFHYYDASTLLVVNSAEIDLVNHDSDYELLLDYILKSRRGSRNYFNPTPPLL